METDTELPEFYEGDEEADKKHIKPCQTCRKRKVKCSKTEPCSNCERADLECVYDDHGTVGLRRSRSTAALAERVAQLEALIGKLSQQTSFRPESGNFDLPAAETPSGRPVYIADRVAEAIWNGMPTDPMNRLALHQGRLITNGGSSRHLMNAFWASMYDEVH
jgi:hypothetical protein